jgi:hypothetical protein
VLDRAATTAGSGLGAELKILAGARTYRAEREAETASDRTNLIRIMPAKGGAGRPCSHLIEEP